MINACLAPLAIETGAVLVGPTAVSCGSPDCAAERRSESVGVHGMSPGILGEDLRGDGLHESGGFIVHFFSRELVELLARGFQSVEVAEFEEGDLPRRLFLVTLVTPAL